MLITWHLLSLNLGYAYILVGHVWWNWYLTSAPLGRFDTRQNAFNMQDCINKMLEIAIMTYHELFQNISSPNGLKEGWKLAHSSTCNIKM